MKDIILPWSCKTHEKLKTLRNWTLRFMFPVVWIIPFVTDLYKISPVGVVVMFFVGMIGTAFTWMVSIIIWRDDGMFPSIKCKCNTKEADG